MNRRTFFSSLAAGAATALARPVPLLADIPKMTIKRIRFYHNPRSRPMFNQSFHIVTVETDQGIIGIGEGGSRDTIAECAGMLIGDDPSKIDYLWQLVYRGHFYPAGREKLHALGALDMALWDIKGKALGVPVYELLGGLARNHVECYSTGFPGKGSLKETAHACIQAGFRAFRWATADPPDGHTFNSHEAVRKTFEGCQEIREGVGKDGDWSLDYHTRFDFPDAVRLSTLIEPLEPYFAEDLIPGIPRLIEPSASPVQMEANHRLGGLALAKFFGDDPKSAKTYACDHAQTHQYPRERHQVDERAE